MTSAPTSRLEAGLDIIAGKRQRTVKHAILAERAMRDFREWVKYWHFKNRETGGIHRFAPAGTPCEVCPPRNPCIPGDLWPGQRDLIEEMIANPWLFALKAGKLGFSELECCWDAWVAYRQVNARVHITSKDKEAAVVMLSLVRFGLLKMPRWFGIRIASGAGSNTTKSIMLRVNDHPDDVRTIVSYAAKGSVAIDQSAHHTHCDELSHVEDGQALWNSIATTVAPGHSIHIVTRGAGDEPYTAKLWEAAVATPRHLQGQHGYLRPFFAPFDKRPPAPGRDREQLISTGTMTVLGASFFLPSTAEDALAGDDESPYIPIEIWDQLRDPRLGAPDARWPHPEAGSLVLGPEDRTPLILSLDAAVTQDCFGAVLVSRYPSEERKRTDVALRLARKWDPKETVTGRIDFDDVERWVKWICAGGCFAGHPRIDPVEGCEKCADPAQQRRGLNIVQICYDPHQLEDMAGRLKKLGLTWVKAFDQQGERLESDALLLRLAMQGRLAHDGNQDLREHIANAKAKVSADEDSKVRIIKRSPSRKIDLAVAAAMAAKRCLDLNLV